MCNMGRTQCGDKDKNGSTLFWRTIFLTVIVCVIGMIICGIMFAWTSFKFSDQLTDTLLQIQHVSLSDGSNIIPSNNADVASSDHSSLTASNETAMLDSYIKHMESMVAIQKSGMTNDLMSFIYGILTAILIGVCATLVVRSRDNADEAKRAVEKAINNADAANKTVDEAKKTADEAKESAQEAKRHAEEAKQTVEKAKNSAIEVKTYMDKANDSARQAKEQADIAEREVQDAEKSIKEAQAASIILQYQLKLAIITGQIASAKSALLLLEQNKANQLILSFYKAIHSLPSDTGFKKILTAGYFDRQVLDDIGDGLIVLRDSVKIFREEGLKKKPESHESIEKAAKNYDEWIETSLKSLDALFKEMPDPRKTVLTDRE